MNLTAKQNCSAFVQVLERFSGVFSRGMLALDSRVKLIQQAPTFHEKDWEEMLMLRTLCNRKVRFAFCVHSKADQRLKSSLILK